jgi:hypothetical protein
VVRLNAEEENTSPVELTEEEVKLAKEGKSREIHEPKLMAQGPVELTEKEVKLAKEGKFKEIHERKI